MKCLFNLVLVTLLGISCADQSVFQVLKGPYFGQKPPGEKAELFAHDLLTGGNQEFQIIFSPDTEEFIYLLSTSAGRLLVEPKGVFGRYMTMYSQMENGYWTEPTALTSNEGFRIGYCSFHPQGKRLYFNFRGHTNNKPEKPTSRIWYMDKIESGWSEAVEVDFGKDYNGPGTVYPSVASNGNLYFAQFHDRVHGYLFLSRFKDGKYFLPEKLSLNINDVGGNHPYIAPDESFIIYDSVRPGETYGTSDLYISFRGENGDWMEPQNLGEGINSPYDERRAFLTFDQKYLFFVSDRINPERPDRPLTITELQKLTNVRQNGYQHLYWVDAKIISKLRP